MDSQSKPHVLKEMPPPSPQKKKIASNWFPLHQSRRKKF